LGGFRDEHKENIMLVLSRKVLEEIVIGENIVVTVLQLSGGKVRIGIKAPESVRIMRAEIDEEEKRGPRKKKNS
jgi:carbon storage regulator